MTEKAKPAVKQGRKATGLEERWPVCLYAIYRDSPVNLSITYHWEKTLSFRPEGAMGARRMPGAELFAELTLFNVNYCGGKAEQQGTRKPQQRRIIYRCIFFVYCHFFRKIML
jgi:hypothetical protein